LKNDMDPSLAGLTELFTKQNKKNDFQQKSKSSDLGLVFPLFFSCAVADALMRFPIQPH